MDIIIQCLEGIFNAIPISLLEGWGRFGFAVGLVLMLAAYTGFSLRPGGRWGLGRERQNWNTKALLSIVLTFLLVISTGYIGSFIVLVPGAQTFESLKDLSVFLCVVLFGYPALLAIPFAYGISDLVEGVPPEFIWDWMLGYFINPACFWLACQFIGKNPDFRLRRTWRGYGLFVLVFMAIEPFLWGYICSEKFTPDIAYHNITPALFFTTAVTWVIAPWAMLAALPLAKKFGLFWAEIPGHVKERILGRQQWVWQSGRSLSAAEGEIRQERLPIRVFLAIPLIILVLALVISVAFVTMSSAERGANRLAQRLHQEVSLNIGLQLDSYFAGVLYADPTQRISRLNHLLESASIARQGRVFLMDRAGVLVASSLSAADGFKEGQLALGNPDPVVAKAARSLLDGIGSLRSLHIARQLRFTIVTGKPLTYATWQAQATPYGDASGYIDWIVVTAMPESAYLGEVRVGNSQSAIVLAIALTISVLLALLLAGVMSAPLRRLSRSLQELASGKLSQPVAGSRLREVDVLAKYFNNMAGQLQHTMANLEAEVDIQTQMKEALTNLSNRLQLATRAANMGIWDWDLRSDELIWDSAMYRLYGMAENRGITYKVWFSALHPQDRAQMVEKIRATLAGTCEFSHEFRIVWPSDGSVHTIKAAAQTLRAADGEPVRMIGMNVDISQSKLAEAELRKHRDHLEELVAERTRELTEARDQAEAANRSKSTFLSNMSHEIRTPLNAIMGMTYLALCNETNVRQRNYLQKVDNAAHGLLGIINDILDFSKIEAGKLKIERAPFLLDDVLVNLIDIILAKAQEKNLEVLIDMGSDVPKALIGDSLRLGQILLNLFSNAVKFTERGEITLSVNCLERDARQVLLEFQVKDTGIGMTQEQAERLFTPFEQADSSTTRRFGGTGLGLSICKKLVEMMGGAISLQTRCGVGSLFAFTLRADLQAEQPAPISLAVDKLRILVVDDSEKACAILLAILAGFSCQAKAVNSASAGVVELENAQQQGAAYDLVFIDSNMPGISGVDAVRAIRARAAIAKTPLVLMVNAMAGEDWQAQTQDLHLAGLLEKPLAAAAVADVIATASGVQGVARSHPKRELHQREAAADLSGCHVLLVEDHDINRELAGELLTGIGVIVDFANNGQEAIAMIARNQYDAVLMDCQMPVMDGYTATLEIRKDRRFAQLPIIAMSANAMAGDRDKCLAAGMNDHIAKPFEIEHLFRILSHWIKSRAPSDAVDSSLPAVAAGLAEVAGAEHWLDQQPLDASQSLPFCHVKAKVLVVEDNLVNQEIAVAMLENLGLQIAIAHNGAEAIAMLAQAQFAVVLMDCQMPVMDGYQATSAIRQQERGKGTHTPIVALTANAVADDRAECLRAGMDDYLAKPFTQQQLLQLLQHWLPQAAQA